MYNFLKKKLKKYFGFILFYNRLDHVLYYGNYKGSFNFCRVFLWNIIHPGRLYNRFRFGQLLRFKNNNSKNFSKELIFFDKREINLQLKFKEFLDQGGVVIENYFSEETIDSFLKAYSPDIDNIKSKAKDKNVNIGKRLTINDELLNIWLDSLLMKFIKNFYGKDFFARNYPNINYVNVKEHVSSKLYYKNQVKKEIGFVNGLSISLADHWHVDHSVLLNVHVILDDLSENDTCMEYIPYSHNYANMAVPYSDEVVSSLNINPIKCVGKKGTVYMHQGNTMHRLNPKVNSNRLLLHFEFTAGSNVLLNCNYIAESLINNYDLEKINVERRDILSGIFPKRLEKGYEIKKKNSFKPTSFKGI